MKFYPLIADWEIKDLDIVIDEYDEKGKLKFNLVPTFCKDLQPHCGLYLLKFSNGMFYVGKAKNMIARQRQHFVTILNGDTKDWHFHVNFLLQEAAKKTGRTIRDEFFHNVKFQIQYTSSVENAEKLEKMALDSIYKKHFTDRYYNTEYFIRQKNGRYKRELLSKHKPKKVDFSQYLF